MTPCPAQTGPVWKTGGEVCGCVLSAGHETSPDVHERDHVCDCGAWWIDADRRDQPAA